MYHWCFHTSLHIFSVCKPVSGEGIDLVYLDFCEEKQLVHGKKSSFFFILGTKTQPNYDWTKYVIFLDNLHDGGLISTMLKLLKKFQKTSNIFSILFWLKWWIDQTIE